MSGRRMLIYFDQTQNERGRLDTTYSELRQLLRDNDYDVEAYTDFMLLPKEIKSAGIMVFGCPNSSKLRKAEIAALKEFVKEGGGLMLLSHSGGDRGLMNNMSDVSKPFGITFENTAIKDDKHNDGLPTMPFIRDLEDHAIMEEIDEILLPSGCTLEVESKAEVLAKTGGTADPPSRPVIAVAEHGKGRVICIGSYEVFRRGGGFKKEGNKTFALNAFSWLNRMRSAPQRAEDRTKNDSLQEDKRDSGSAAVSEEFENTLRRLVNAVFDLQKDIETATEKVERVENNIDALRNQFQDFAQKTQDQLGVIIPAKQFKTEDENRAADLEADIKSLNAELKSVKQLQDHIEDRHSSGAMPRDAYEEQAEKLAERVKSLEKRTKEKKKELEDLAK
ncbi:hypothetical protein EU537_01865 [Candidatus Thorarchaeota archaeon]|nr:MAG: hypothetical protein EU537_01865 [Candidatus Thorarchaeota archaeon]